MNEIDSGMKIGQYTNEKSSSRKTLPFLQIKVLVEINCIVFTRVIFIRKVSLIKIGTILFYLRTIILNSNNR